MPIAPLAPGSVGVHAATLKLETNPTGARAPRLHQPLALPQTSEVPVTLHGAGCRARRQRGAGEADLGPETQKAPPERGLLASG